MRGIVLFIATGAGTGYAPAAPGTAGAFLGLLLYALGLRALDGPIFLLTLAAALALAVWSSGGAIVAFGRPDPPQVTIDEVVGMLVTLAFLPATVEISAGPLTVDSGLVVGFVFFRLFDILKPFPIRWIERAFPGGFGVVLDDVAAGLYANLALRIAALFLAPS